MIDNIVPALIYHIIKTNKYTPMTLQYITQVLYYLDYLASKSGGYTITNIKWLFHGSYIVQYDVVLDIMKSRLGHLWIYNKNPVRISDYGLFRVYSPIVDIDVLPQEKIDDIFIPRMILKLLDEAILEFEKPAETYIMVGEPRHMELLFNTHNWIWLKNRKAEDYIGFNDFEKFFCAWGKLKAKFSWRILLKSKIKKFLNWFK